MTTEYPPRPKPKPIGVCKCGHEYREHEVDFFPGNWLERNCVFFWKMAEGGKECRECMCPEYEQIKIIDRNTGNEIQKGNGVNQE